MKPLLSFPNYAKESQQYASVDEAVIISENVGIFDILLSFMPVTVEKSGIEEMNGHLPFFVELWIDYFRNLRICNEYLGCGEHCNFIVQCNFVPFFRLETLERERPPDVLFRPGERCRIQILILSNDFTLDFRKLRQWSRYIEALQASLGSWTNVPFKYGHETWSFAQLPGTSARCDQPLLLFTKLPRRITDRRLVHSFCSCRSTYRIHFSLGPVSSI